MPDHEHPLRDRLLVTTKSDVDISFDPAKDEADIRKHGLCLATFIGFDDRPVTVIDDRLIMARFASGRSAGLAESATSWSMWKPARVFV